MSLQNMRLYCIIKFWIKILHTNENKYIRKIYNTLYTDILSNHTRQNWCSKLKNIGSSLGLHDAWYVQTVGDSTLILSLVKQRIKDQFLQNWNSRFIYQRQVGLYFIETLQTLLFNHI